ncbi:hypothetical protein AKJ08_1335 [Vulgatibacter incomptus]|uniref:SbsA Ig-like domain-containing protein n=1 Tax=Vulgatibacter incomptus TaxID=1391653 RepID=A0A0K1PBN4_9BACT|nr:hypothetical protein AKJ08_1335 [Vulgatibacter incomptus]
MPLAAQVVTTDGLQVALQPEGAGDTNAEGIPAEATIVLTSEHALTDLRIRLVDEAGKLVPSDDRATIGKGTRYELRPQGGLVTGTRYRLLVDGNSSSHPSSVDGTTFAGRSFSFRTAGEKPAPPPPPAKAPRKAKRR